MIYDFHLSFRIHDFSRGRKLSLSPPQSLTRAGGLGYCLFVATTPLKGRAIPTAAS